MNNLVRSILLFLMLLSTSAATLLPSERANAKLLEYAQNEYKNQNFLEAYNAFLRIDRTEHNLPTIYYYLGRCSYEMGAYEQAEAHYRDLLALKPNDSLATYELARIELKYARRHENKAKLLFSTIPPDKLDNKSEEILAGYSGFGILPHPHRLNGSFIGSIFHNSNAGENPHLIDPKISHLDPTPSITEKLESSSGTLVEFELQHSYQDSNGCGIKWENGLETGWLNYNSSAIKNPQTARYFGFTKLAFRVYENFWVAPEYFIRYDSFINNLVATHQEGWALNISGDLNDISKAWARASIYNHKFINNFYHTTSANKAFNGLIGYKYLLGLDHVKTQVTIDYLYDQNKSENELGLYTQNSFELLYHRFFTPSIQSEIGFEYLINNFKTTLGKRKNKILSPYLKLDWQINRRWAIDYVVKIVNTASDDTDSSYTQNIAKAGIHYKF